MALFGVFPDLKYTHVWHMRAILIEYKVMIPKMVSIGYRLPWACRPPLPQPSCMGPTCSELIGRRDTSPGLTATSTGYCTLPAHNLGKQENTGNGGSERYMEAKIRFSLDTIPHQLRGIVVVVGVVVVGRGEA